MNTITLFNNIDVLIGNNIETLKTIPSESVNTCITSPPYYGLRDYGDDDQIGLENTPEEYIESLVQVFREVKRVLRDDGTLWLNLGDSYAGSGKGQTIDGADDPKNNKTKGMRVGVQSPSSIGYKAKDLMGIPWRVAFALQQDGWYLRQDIIWDKPNPMPSSVRDRCTTAHEYIFLLSKNSQYYYDAEAIKEPSIHYGEDARSDKGNIRYEGKRTSVDASIGGQQSFVTINKTRNKRSVWTVTTKPFSGSHFAVFPPDLIEPCVLAGCPRGGVILDPFAGSGTTGGVALKHNRKAILCELNEDYVDIMKNRIRQVVNERTVEEVCPSQISLF